MAFSNISYTCLDRIGYIEIQRKEKRNALSPLLIGELLLCFNKASNDDTCKVVVLKADGPVFSAGADLEYLNKILNDSEGENLEDSMRLKELFETVYHLNKVVIAQVEGDAIAGGCGLATICDFVFSIPTARFGYTEVKIGFVPALVSVFLIRKVGEAKAKELLLTGELIDAAKAQSIGLINYIESKNEIKNKVVTFASNLCKNASFESLKRTKKTINIIQEKELDEALVWSAKMNASSRQTKDCKKGIKAFLNRGEITW
ncbi:MAG: enoyl-CoA hydratase/isomerase family protein [Flavobacteriales bacterium]|nr:enoyl-CoA hydratase/isomerase family protein [Flavobacteriales bacterium]